MSMFSGKLLLMLVGVIMLTGFLFGFLRWDNYAYKCIDGRHFSFEDWQVAYQIGRLQLRYHPLNFSCPASEPVRSQG